VGRPRRSGTVEGCEFCRVAAGEQDAYRIHENEGELAIPDENPATEEDTLVLPTVHRKRSPRWTWGR